MICFRPLMYAPDFGAHTTSLFVRRNYLFGYMCVVSEFVAWRNAAPPDRFVLHRPQAAKNGREETQEESNPHLDLFAGGLFRM